MIVHPCPRLVSVNDVKGHVERVKRSHSDHVTHTCSISTEPRDTCLFYLLPFVLYPHPPCDRDDKEKLVCSSSPCKNSWPFWALPECGRPLSGFALPCSIVVLLIYLVRVVTHCVAWIHRNGVERKDTWGIMWWKTGKKASRKTHVQKLQCCWQNIIN